MESWSPIPPKKKKKKKKNENWNIAIDPHYAPKLPRNLTYSLMSVQEKKHTHTNFVKAKQTSFPTQIYKIVVDYSFSWTSLISCS